MRGLSLPLAAPRGRARHGALAAASVVLALLAAGVLAQRWLAADADGDGVADRADACPGTPPGRVVDARGCCPAARALASAVAALRAADAPAMEIGEAWFLQQLAAQRPDPDLRALVADTERRLATHRAARLLRPDAAPLPLPEDPGHGIARLANYINAPAGAPPARAAAFIDDFTAAPATGYVLTHQLLVLEWARHVGLALPPAVAQRRAGLQSRIAAEQAADARFSDLFAERAAILLAFTTPEPREADRWMDVIAAAAPADGRWLSTRSAIAYDGQQASASHPWVHTTGFVAAASGFYLLRRGTSAAPLP
ncbi:MAG TPA: hypothetical protein VL049_22180 [Candidatus Dormibacteraeota bacterium]|nr:hypothetical protein [Candidatus Dormibacteraeota bacterium]